MAARNRDSRRFERAVTRVDITNVLTLIPAPARNTVYEFLVEAHERFPEGFSDDNLLEDPYCDGAGVSVDGTQCNHREGLDGAVESLQIARSVPGLTPVLTTPFVGSEIASITAYASLFTNTEITEVHTVESKIIDHVETHEHKLHRIGMKMTKRNGMDMARAHLGRWMLLLELVYNVPMVEAAGFSFDVYGLLRIVYTLWLSLTGVLTRLLTERVEIFHSQTAALAKQLIWLTNWSRVYNFSTCASNPYRIHNCISAFIFEWLGFKGAYEEVMSKDGVIGDPIPVFQHAPILIVSFLYLCALLAACWTLYISCRVCSYIYQRHRIRLLAERLHRSFPQEIFTDETRECAIDNCAQALYKAVTQSRKPIDIVEMSQRGSAVQKAAHVPGLLHLIKLDSEDVTCIGMAFRYADYLVTVEHNISALESVPGVSYMVPFQEKNGSSLLDMRLAKELTPEMISRDIVPDHFKHKWDLAIIPVGNKLFSTLGLKSLVDSHSVWGASVVLTGLTAGSEFTLQRSVGNILKDETAPFHRVRYNASTFRGWSGTPVLVKQRVVAMHCGTDGEHNYGLNFSLVLKIIASNSAGLEANYHYEGTSPSVHTKEYQSENRDNWGMEVDYEDYTDDYGSDSGVDIGSILRDKRSGRVSTRTREETQAMLNWKPKGGGPSWADQAYEDETEYIGTAHQESGKTRFSVAQPLVTIPEKATAACAESPRRKELFLFPVGFGLIKSRGSVKLSAPFFKGYPVNPDRHIDVDRAVELGYESGKYEFPKATTPHESAQISMRSLSKYLEMSVEVAEKGTPPTDDTRSKAINIVLEMLKPARFTTDCTGVTLEKIKAQIDSNLVDGSKSPGLPFVPKFLTNADVIKEYGSDGLAQLIYDKWIDGTWNEHSVAFLKIDAAKTEKAEQGLDRCVQSVSLVTNIIFRCFFAELGASTLKAYRKCPVAAGWSPLRPGDAQFMHDKITGGGKKKDRKIFSYDGKAYEFTAHTEEAYADVSKIMTELAVQGKGVSESRFVEYKRECLNFLNEVGKMGYQLHNGLVIQKMKAFILNSGRWDTFTRNSITGLYWDTTTKLDIGYTKVEIISDFIVTVGGDDNTQNVPGSFNHENYRSQMASYGLPIHKIEIVDVSVKEFEFFSWKFSLDSHGYVKFVPTRFTKHVASFRATAHENRPQALCSHMMNWAHDEDKFFFFRDCFMAGHEEDPDAYKLDLLIDRLSYLTYLRGDESTLSLKCAIPEFDPCV